jgi:hypothetical protein
VSDHRCPSVHVRFGELLAAAAAGAPDADVKLLCLHHCVEGATCGPGDFTFRDEPDVIPRSALPRDVAVPRPRAPLALGAGRCALTGGISPPATDGFGRAAPPAASAREPGAPLRIPRRRPTRYPLGRHVTAPRQVLRAGVRRRTPMATRSGWLPGPLALDAVARAAAIGAAEREVFALGEWSVRAVDVRQRRPIEIECLAGELLVTAEGDLEDHIVPAGESFRVSRRGRVVVAALVPSRVRIGELRPGGRAAAPRPA